MAMDGKPVSALGLQSVFVTTALFAASIFAVAVRFYARKVRNLAYEIDDWVTLLALFLLGSMYVSWILFATIAYEGYHVHELTPSQARTSLKGLFGIQITYTFACPVIKISILLFYRRLFATRKFHMASMLVILSCIAWFIAIFLLDIFQCTPVTYQWDKSIKGKCINNTKSFVGNGIANIIIDFATLLLPMPIIWRLQRTWQVKLGLTAIFALGSFVCIAGIIRTVFLSTFYQPDAPYTVAEGATWSFVEPSLGLVCGSLPMLRALIPRKSPSRSPLPIGPGQTTSSTICTFSKRQLGMQKLHDTAWVSENGSIWPASNCLASKQVARNHADARIDESQWHTVEMGPYSSDERQRFYQSSRSSRRQMKVAERPGFISVQKEVIIS